MEESEKLRAFEDLMEVQRKNVFSLVRTYLLQYNPKPESIQALKCILENMSLISEDEIDTFMDDWAEYKKTFRESIEIQQRESMRNNFDALIAKNFPGIK